MHINSLKASNMGLNYSKISKAIFNNRKGRAIPNLLVGLSALGALSVQSCEKEIAVEAFNYCPYSETVFTNMPKVSQRVDYVFQTLGLLPNNKSIYEIDSICFSDKNRNRIQLSTPRDSADCLKMDMKKISANGETLHDNINFFNHSSKMVRIQAPLMPAHNNSHLLQSEFWDSPGFNTTNTFTEIRNESNTDSYNHYLLEKTKYGFQSRAAKGRGDSSKTEVYSDVNISLKNK